MLRVDKQRLVSSTWKGAGPGKRLRFGVVGPREVVLSPSLGVFKMTFNKTLSSLMADPAWSRRLEQRPPEVPSNLNFLTIL